MKRRSTVKAIIATLILFAITPMAIIPSSATPPLPPTLRSGSYASGAQIHNDSGLIIKNQTVTIDINDFPTINDTDKMKEYSGSVRTDYTLFNPTESEIKVNIAFPVGAKPSYQYGIDNSSLTSKYAILVNGEAVAAELRHVYNNYNYEQTSDFLNIISDEYYDSAFCSPDMTVTKYTFKQSDITEANAFVGFDIKKDSLTGSCIYIGKDAFCWYQDDHDGRINLAAGENGCTYEMYVIGKDITHLPEWKVYKNVSVRDGDEIEGKIEYVGKECMSFLDFVSLHYDRSTGINELDFFNMTAAETASCLERNLFFTNLIGMNTLFEEYAHRGLIYEITLSPGEELVNSFIEPIYPDVETGYEPYLYVYSYRLYHKNAEMLTNKISFNLNTPYYLLYDDEFEKTDTGYSLSFNAKEVLSESTSVIRASVDFTLCEVENPEKTKTSNPAGWILLLILFVLLPIGLIIEAVKSIVKAVRNGFQSIKSRLIR